MTSLRARRAAVTHVMQVCGLGVTRACGLIGISRALYRYEARLNEHWFVSMQHASETIAAWRRECNGERPHSSFG